MAVDITQGGLQWKASIDYSELEVDANNIEKILGKLGGSVIDVGDFKADMNTVKDVMTGSIQQAVSQVEEDTKKGLQVVAEQTKKVQEDIAANAQPLIVTAETVAEEKKMVDEITAYQKTQIQQLFDYQKELNQQGFTGSVFQTTGTKAKPDQQKNPLSDVLNDDFKKIITDAENAFQSLDQETKDFLDNLVRLETQLQKNKSAQKEINAANKEGKISTEDFNSAMVVLAAQEKDIKENLSSLVKGQKEYDALTAASVTSINEKKESLEQLKLAYNELTEAGRQSTQGIELAQDIKVLSTEIKSLDPTAILKVKDGFKGAYTELSQLKNQIASGALEGEALEIATKRAIDLQHQVDNVTKSIKLAASNTAGVDALVQGVNGLVGAFTALQGVSALFSDDNKAIEKSVRDVTSAMAILQGVQQVSTVLAKNSALNTFLLAQYQKLSAVSATEQAVATGAVVVAEEAQAVAAGEAAIATEGLNVAMAANPAGVLLIALTAVVAAIQLFSSNTDEAVEKQTKMNEALAEANTLYSSLVDLYNQPFADRTKAAEQAVQIAQASGASEKEIFQLRQKALELRREDNLRALSSLDIEGSSVEEKTKSLHLLQAELEVRKEEELSLLRLKSINGELTKDEQQKLENIQSQQKVLESTISPASKFLDGIKEAEKQQAEAAAAQQKKAEDDSLKSNVAYWQARVELAKKGSEDEKNALIRLAAAQKALTLSNNNITKGEITKANADYQKSVQDANRKFTIAQLEDQKSVIDAQLQSAKKGSEEELKFKIDILNKTAAIQIQNAQGNAAAIKDIEAKNAKDISELRKQYSFEIAKSEIDARISQDNTFLATVKKDSEEELAFKKQLNIDKEALDELNAEKSIQNEQELNAKLKELRAQLYRDNEKLDDNYIVNYLDKQKEKYQREAEQAKLANNAIITDPLSSRRQRFQAQEGNFGIDKNELNQELSDTNKAIEHATGDLLDQLLKRKQDIEKAIAAINNAMSALEKKNKIEALKEIGDNILSLSSALQGLANDLADVNPALADSISTLSQLGNVAGNAVGAFAKFSSGDIIGGIGSAISAIGSVFSLGAKARESARKAAAEMKAFQDEQIRGEIEYNELLRDRIRSQDDISKLTNDELKARQAMLALQKQQAQADYDRLLKQIQDTGQQITGQHTEKFGGFFGIGKKTKVVNDLAGLTGADFDQLEKLFTENKLDDSTKAWFQELQKVHDELDAIGVSAQQAQDELNQRFTGTTSDSILDGIIDGFKNGLRSAEDFADNFQDLMKTAVLNALKFQTLQKPLQDFYDQFANLSASGDILTSDEIAQLQQIYDKILSDAGKQFDNLQQITGLNLTAGGTSGGSALAGAIKGITEQQAELLAGQFGGLRLTAIDILNICTQQLKQIILIVDNTSFIPQSHKIFRDWQVNGIKIKP